MDTPIIEKADLAQSRHMMQTEIFTDQFMNGLNRENLFSSNIFLLLLAYTVSADFGCYYCKILRILKHSTLRRIL